MPYCFQSKHKRHGNQANKLPFNAVPPRGFSASRGGRFSRERACGRTAARPRKCREMSRELRRSPDDSNLSIISFSRVLKSPTITKGVLPAIFGTSETSKSKDFSLSGLLRLFRWRSKNTSSRPESLSRSFIHAQKRFCFSPPTPQPTVRIRIRTEPERAAVETFEARRLVENDDVHRPAFAVRLDFRVVEFRRPGRAELR